MFTKSLLIVAVSAFALSGADAVRAQSTNTNTSPTPTRGRQTTTSTNTNQQTPAATPAPTPTPARGRGRRSTTTSTAASAAAQKAVRDAFDTLIDGIRRADVETVMSVYWNSPQLLLFNNNGTVTRGWEQVRSNRASSYPNLKDVQLDVRDVRVSMLGADAAIVTCLWSQSQTAGGTTDSATGRLTLVFQNIGGAWKAVHTHTSPDRPDPSRLLPSERTPSTGESETTTRPPVKP
ncbi:MAG TPA: nuclear transport factor 2 family protein [Pyrinomonadaceae bacterium]|nr:nuclear transport factor 2 family protein [Pyrinomonadaceae bacterium]